MLNAEKILESLQNVWFYVNSYEVGKMTYG